MANIMVGSARSDENKKLTNGKAGDQRQTSNTNDTAGEVSMQAMYKHSKGWYILRPKDPKHAAAMAENMTKACNNKAIGYDQNGRSGVIKNGIDTKENTESDCSSLVRAVIIASTGKDPGNFHTGTEVEVLGKTGLFEDPVAYTSQTKTPVFDGDVLVTKTKGHTVIVVSGNQREIVEEPTSSTNQRSLLILRSLVKGDKGLGEIATLQRCLKDLGYYTGKIDRSFGSGTEKAVQQFQKDKGIPVSYPGTVGQKTWSVLLTKC